MPANSCPMITAARRFLSGLLTVLALSLAPVDAGPPRFVVDETELYDTTLAAAAKLLADGKLMTPEKLKPQLGRRDCKLELAPATHTKISGPELYDGLRQSTFSVGLLYKEKKTREWAFNSAVGFAVGADGVLCTNYHVASMTGEEDAEKKAGSYLIAADSTGKVYPVVEILASDPESDTAFIRIDARGLKPLPVRPGVRPGEKIFCMSHPEGEHYLFTEGTVARITRVHEAMGEGEEDAKPSSRPLLFVNVTSEYAPGSSGGPVVDECGNVIAQVQSISELFTDDEGVSEPVAPVRTCVAAEEIMHLVREREKKP